MATPLPFRDAPQPSGAAANSDAAKVEANVRSWARDVALAVRGVQSAVSALSASAASSSSSATGNAPTTTATTGTTTNNNPTPAAGSDGWTPLLGLVAVSNKIVVQVTGWTGGEGTPPATGMYLGPNGFTTNPAVAVNLQGPAGATTGAGSSALLTFSTTTTGSPAMGQVEFDNATFASIANVYISRTDRNGADISSILALISIGATLSFSEEGVTGHVANFGVTSITVNSGNYQLGVSPITGVILDNNSNADLVIIVGVAGSGTVTSVALTMPAIFTVAGSPIAGAGTLAVTLDSQSANYVLAGPASGAAAAPGFRLLTAADIPALPYDPVGAAATAQTNAENYADANKLAKSANLSDVASASTALTNILPSQAGNSGKVLGTNGIAASWVASSGGISPTIVDSPGPLRYRYPSGSPGGSLGYQVTKELVFDIKEYGAAGDGTTDDTTAINNVVSAALAANVASVTVFVPPGYFRTTSQISVAPTRQNGVNIRFIGCGQNVSIIQCDHGGNGLSFDFSGIVFNPRLGSLDLRGIGIIANNPNSPYASSTGLIISYGIPPTSAAAWSSGGTYTAGATYVEDTSCPAWTSGGSYTPYQRVSDPTNGNAIYECYVAISGSSTPPHSDTGPTGHWLYVAAANPLMQCIASVSGSTTDPLNDSTHWYLFTAWHPPSPIVRVDDVQIAHYSNVQPAVGTTFVNPATGASINPNNNYGWTQGVQLTNVWDARFSYMVVKANETNYSQGPITNPAGTGSAWVVNGGVSIDWYRVDCYFWQTSAWRFVTTGGIIQPQQDVNLIYCEVLDCVNSIYVNATSATAATGGFGALSMTGCGFSNTDYDVSARYNQQQITVLGAVGPGLGATISFVNCFISQQAGAHGTPQPMMVFNGQLTGSTMVGCVLGNFTDASGPAATIQFANYCANIVIDSNSFQSSGTDITIDSTCTGIQIGGANSAEDASGNTKYALTVTDSAAFGNTGNYNLNLRRFLLGKGTRAILTSNGGYYSGGGTGPSNSSVPSGAEYPVSFSGTDYDDLAQLVGYTQIYMPGAPTAVRRVTATFNCRWDNSSAGTVRQIKIKDQAGNTYAEAILPPLVSPNGNTGMAMSVTTGEVDTIIKGISYFQCFVYQDSGSAVALIANHTSFVVQYNLENG